jgi:hypothetical protein
MKHVAYFLSIDKFSFIMDTQLVPMWLRCINKQKTLLDEFFASRIDTKPSEYEAGVPTVEPQ